MGQQNSTYSSKPKKISEEANQLLQLRSSWNGVLKKLESTRINTTDLRCLIASGYADALIGSVRGVLRHLEEKDPINAFRILRTTFECLVKFKCLIKDDSFLEKLKTDSLHRRQYLFKKAKDPVKGVGLEVLQTAPCDDIDFNKKYACLNFADLCNQIGWMQPYNLIYWYTSSVSHVDLDQILLTFSENVDGSFEINPYGESSHDQDFQLILSLMEWFVGQFSLVLVEFEDLQHATK